jgi:hypothetical protein
MKWSSNGTLGGKVEKERGFRKVYPKKTYKGGMKELL